MTNRLLAILAACAITLSGALTTTPANAATSCTKVWLAAPSYFGHYDTGQRRCIWPDDKANGWTKIYFKNDRTKHVVDYTMTYTHTPPHDGRVKTTAWIIRDLADQYGVTVQFADRDQLGRRGCYGSFRNHVTGTYQPRVQPEYAGKGLIRIGTGTIKRCMHDVEAVTNVFKYEASRATIERICGRVDPPHAYGDRNNAVTAAYSIKYLGATMNDGGVKPTREDYWRAGQIHQGRCQ